MTDLTPHIAVARKLRDNLEQVMVGKSAAVRMALVPLLARGHLLIEDVPGVGKTTLAKAIARSIDGEFRRVQFTADLLPMDLTGGSVFNQKTADFEFRKGPIFADILLADEVNRATPRTQSALLECMEESQASIDGTTHRLGPSFFVVATLNPVEQTGTFELPESQLDRFLLRLAIGYPDEAGEIAIFDAQRQRHPLESLTAVTNTEEVAALRTAVGTVHVEDSVKSYAARLVRMTREHVDALLGASPRGTLSLLRAAQALAVLDGRTFVAPEDVKSLAGPVLGHRLVLRPQAAVQGQTGAAIAQQVASELPPPVLPGA